MMVIIGFEDWAVIEDDSSSLRLLCPGQKNKNAWEIFKDIYLVPFNTYYNLETNKGRIRCRVYNFSEISLEYLTRNTSHLPDF